MATLKEKLTQSKWRTIAVYALLIAFALYMAFIDENSLLQYAKYQHKISTLEREIDRYENIIKVSREELNELRSNEDNLEKFAREKYLMKRADEDLFLIEE